MPRHPLYLILFLILFSINCAQPAEEPAPSMTEPPGSEHEGKAFTFDKIREDVYHARGTGSLAVGCNTTVIINEEDVMLVDSHISPAAIWVLMDELQAITPKPIKYVVNTHFHFDHAHGNQMMPDDVEIIGHEYTRDMIAAGNSYASIDPSGDITPPSYKPATVSIFRVNLRRGVSDTGIGLSVHAMTRPIMSDRTMPDRITTGRWNGVSIVDDVALTYTASRFSSATPSRS